MARLAAAYLLALLAAGAPAGAFRRPLPRTRASSAIGAISSGADFAAPTSEEPLPTQTRPAIPAALVALEEKVNAALRGDAAALRAAIASNVNIDDAALDAKDLAGLEAEVIGVAKLMEDPVLSFVEATDAGADAVRVTWIASGTWGAPWNPRIVATGTADVTLDAATGMVSRVATAWDRSPSSAFFSQIFPDVWDARTWFACPKVERSPYQVVHKGEGFEVRDYLPRTVLKMSFVDPTGKPERKVAKLLPDFCMTGELMTAGRLADPWWATAEPECFIRRLTPEEEAAAVAEAPKDAAEDAGAFRHVAWDVALPSRNGVDAAALPAPAMSTDDYPEVVSAERFALRECRHEVQPRRRIAVLSANDAETAQDPLVPQLRKALADALAAEGIKMKVSAEGGRPEFGFIQGGIRAGFNEDGVFSIVAYEPRSIGNTGSYVTVEVEV